MSDDINIVSGNGSAEGQIHGDSNLSQDIILRLQVLLTDLEPLITFMPNIMRNNPVLSWQKWAFPAQYLDWVDNFIDRVYRLPQSLMFLHYRGNNREIEPLSFSWFDPQWMYRPWWQQPDIYQDETDYSEQSRGWSVSGPGHSAKLASTRIGIQNQFSGQRNQNVSYYNDKEYLRNDSPDFKTEMHLSKIPFSDFPLIKHLQKQRSPLLAKRAYDVSSISSLLGQIRDRFPNIAEGQINLESQPEFNRFEMSKDIESVASLPDLIRPQNYIPLQKPFKQNQVGITEGRDIVNSTQPEVKIEHDEILNDSRFSIQGRGRPSPISEFKKTNQNNIDIDEHSEPFVQLFEGKAEANSGRLPIVKSTRLSNFNSFSEINNMYNSEHEEAAEKPTMAKLPAEMQFIYPDRFERNPIINDDRGDYATSVNNNMIGGMAEGDIHPFNNSFSANETNDIVEDSSNRIELALAPVARSNGTSGQGRVEESSESPSRENEQRPAEIDQEQLAADVYSILKRRFLIERERSQGISR